jgi:hypothetical protein
MTDFCRDLLGLTQTLLEPGFAVFDLPNGDQLEIFGPAESTNTFITHPVARFLVDDIVAARSEMEAKGIEFIVLIEERPKTTSEHISARRMALSVN